MSTFVPTSPCVTCGEVLVYQGLPRCQWMREKVTWTEISLAVPGERIHDFSGTRLATVIAVERVDSMTTRFVFRQRSKDQELIVRSSSRVRVSRIARCWNLACDRHLRELAPDHVICAECWPLQMAVIRGVAA